MSSYCNNQKLKFLKEPNNLKGKNSYRFSGLVHRKAVGVEPTKDNTGIVLTTRKQTGNLVTFVLERFLSLNLVKLISFFHFCQSLHFIARNKPARNLNKVTFKASNGSRRVLSKIRRTIRKTGYRNDLKNTALRRASAFLRAQKPKSAQKNVTDKKANTKADK
jgi:large subunit ribosomal protein L28e